MSARWPGWRRRLARLDSLKARMALLMGLVLVFPAGYAVVQAIGVYAGQSARTAASLQRTARLIATYQASILDNARGALERIAKAHVEAGLTAECDATLAEELRQSAEFSVLAMSDPLGQVLCASSASLVGRSVADTTWFSDLERGFRFVVSEITQVPRGSGSDTIVIAITLGGDAKATGSLLAGLRLIRFSAVPSTLELPEGAIAYLTDAAGGIVPDLLQDLPQLAPVNLERLLAEPGRPRFIPLAGGPRRVLVAEPVLGGRLFVIVGLPMARWPWLDRELMIGILAPVVMLGLALLGVWIATDFLIIRYVRRLGVMARAQGRSLTVYRADLGGAPPELRHLAQTMGNMAQRLQAREADLQASLEQKDVLLREIHHRVKNNLQIVTSLLNLRARSIASQPARQALLEAQMRIKALALVHRNLYEQEEVKTVELGTFLVELGELLREIADAPNANETELLVEADAVIVPTDQAIPIALLVTEAVSNAYKHAFPEGRQGTIQVSLQATESGGRLAVADDGVGMDEPAELPDSGGIGLTLIEMLAKQIGGRLEVTRSGGTRLEIAFTSGAIAPPGVMRAAAAG